MTAKVILSMDGLILKEIPINKERMTVGRRPENDIQIDNLAISGQHAVIISILGDSFLEDLNSTNGTYINGQLVKKHILKHNDIVELGKYRLKFLNEKSAGATDDFEKTMVLRPEAIRQARQTKDEIANKSSGDTQIGAAFAQTGVNLPLPNMVQSKTPQPPAAAVASVQPKARAAITPSAPTGTPGSGMTSSVDLKNMGVVQVLSGSSAGRELQLTKNVTTIGKPGVQVAVIAKRDQGYFLTHVEGAKMPTINGQSINGKSHQLTDHDIIEVAGVKMEFYIKK